MQNYEKTFARLEEIASLLEQGSLPLEQSLTLFEEGTGLAAQLQATLQAAELKLTTLNLESRDE